MLSFKTCKLEQESFILQLCETLQLSYYCDCHLANSFLYLFNLNILKVIKLSKGNLAIVII